MATLPMLKYVFVAPVCACVMHHRICTRARQPHLVMVVLYLHSVLNLGSNLFSGAVPSEYGTMSSLAVLNISSNALIGSLPASWLEHVWRCADACCCPVLQVLLFWLPWCLPVRVVLCAVSWRRATTTASRALRLL